MPEGYWFRGDPEAAAAGSLGAHDVARDEPAGVLARDLLTVDERASALAGITACGAGGRVATPVSEHREAALLESANLAHDAVAAAMRRRRRPSPSRRRVPLDPERVCQLERLDRSVERVRHRNVHGAMGPSARGLAPWPPPIVS